MEEYKSILKLIDETLKNNNELIEFYRKSATVYETKIAELQQKVDTLEAANRELLKRIEVAE
jgi:hypothetical protein